MINFTFLGNAGLKNSLCSLLLDNQGPRKRKIERREDLLSHLNDHCVLEVLKHLERKDICSIKPVNRRIYSLASDRFLDKVKWRNGELSIARTENGYGFQLSVDYPSTPANTQWRFPWIEEESAHCTTYQYDIYYKYESGDIIEKRQINGLLVGKVPIDTPRDSSVSDYLFTALAKILRQHEAKYIKLTQLPLQSSFITKLQRALKGHCIRSVECTEMICDQITTDARKSFTQFIRKVGKIHLENSDDISALINDDFLSKIGEFTHDNFECDAHPVVAFAHRFVPNDSFFPSLPRFNSFKAFGMVINVNCVADLIMNYLDAAAALNRRSSSLGRWQFSTDQHLTSQHILQSLRTESFDHSTDVPFHYIKRKKAGIASLLFALYDYTAQFGTLRFRAAGGQIIHTVDIEFRYESL